MCDRRTAAAAAAVWLAVFLVYSFMACPTVFWEDSGEFIACAVSGGVPHPPGYPLYCILSRLFAHLPAGNPALNVNLMSAFFGSLAVAGLFVFMRNAGCAVPGALAASGSFAASYTFWYHCLIAEVYTLHLFIFVLALILFQNYARNPARKACLFGLSFCTGLGCSNHTLILLVALPLCVLIFRAAMKAETAKLSPRDAFLCLLFFLAGLLPYAYLPLAAMKHPPLNWGDPASPRSFLDHVTMRAYDHVKFARSWHVFENEFAVFIKTLGEEFGYAFCIAALCGLLLNIRKKQQTVFLLMSIIVLYSVAVCALINYPVQGWGAGIIRVQFIPAHLAIAAFIGMCVDSVCGSLNRAAAFSRRAALFGVLEILVYGIFAIGVVMGAVEKYTGLNRHGSYPAREFARRALDTVPPNATLLAHRDNFYFPLIYMQVVEGYRTDVSVVMELFLAPGYNRSWYEKQIPAVTSGSLFTFNPEHRTKEYLCPRGLLFEVASAPCPPPGSDKRLLGLFDISDYAAWYDRDTRKNYSFIFSNRGHYYMARQMPEEAYTEYRKAIDIYPEGENAHNGMGVTYAALGMPKLSSGEFMAAISLNPYHVQAHSNLGLNLLKEGRKAEAAYHFRKALKVDPRYAPAVEGLKSAQSYCIF